MNVQASIEYMVSMMNVSTTCGILTIKQEQMVCGE